MESGVIFAGVCVLGMFGAAAYHIAMQIKSNWQERHREPPKPTLAEQSEQVYGFNFYDVSHGIDSTVTIREHLETLQRLQTKIDLSRENLYGSYRVVQIQWHDDVQNRYLTYDFPVSYKGNAEILEQLVTATIDHFPIRRNPKNEPIRRSQNRGQNREGSRGEGRKKA